MNYQLSQRLISSKDVQLTDLDLLNAAFPEEQAICVLAGELPTRVPRTEYLERALEVAEDTLTRLDGERTAREVSA